MPHFKLFLSASALFLVPAAIVAVALSIFAYRHTLPPISPGRKYLLITLRSLALFLLLLLLLEPILGTVLKEEKPATIAVLVDDSKSSALTDGRGDRAEKIRALLNSKELGRLSEIGRTKTYRFAGKLAELQPRETLRFDGELTNLSAALKGIRERAEQENLQAVVLVSDGNHNVGEDPLHEVVRLPAPIYTVGIGDSSDQKDVMITRAVTNEIVYTGSRVPMDVTVKSSGFNGERVEVVLLEGGKPLGQQMLTLRQGTWEYPVKFFFEAREEGVNRYTVNVSTLEGEITGANNRKSVFVKVLRSKMKVLLIAGAPSPDLAFVNRVLVEDANVEVRTLVQKNSFQFYDGEFSASLLSDADCIFLVGFPLSDSRDDILRMLLAEIEQKGKPTFVLLSRSVDLAKLRTLEKVLPFTVGPSRKDELSVFIEVPERQRAHPAMKLIGSPDLWDALPPIYKTGSGFPPKPEAEVLAFVKVQGVRLKEPLIVSRSVAGAKSIAVLGYGIWRWKLLTQSAEPSRDVLQSFLSSSVRWLTTREDTRQVRISPTKEIYPGGEPVEFIAQVYDQTYNPLNGAEVKVTVKKDTETLETILSPIGNGRYEGKFESLREGEYDFAGVATSDGLALGDGKPVRGKFSVGSLEIEFQNTRMNKRLLEQIAYQSGGKYFDPEEVGNLVEELVQTAKLVPKEISHEKEYELWSLSSILGLVVLLFAAEWFLRKQSGML